MLLGVSDILLSIFFEGTVKSLKKTSWQHQCIQQILMPELADGSSGNVEEDAVNDAANLLHRTHCLNVLTGSVFTNIQKLFQELYFNLGRSSLFQKFFRYFTSSFFGSGVSSILFCSGYLFRPSPYELQPALFFKFVQQRFL